MWTIFFDIDGTLLRTGGAGLVSMAKVMSQRFGVDQLPQVPVHGRTDRGIWQDVFAELQLELPEDLSVLIDEYCDELEVHLNASNGIELKGVRALLTALNERDDVACCLLTGNAHRAAGIKLAAFGLTDYFLTTDTESTGSELIGGFGDMTGCRNQVAKLAVASAATHLPDFDPECVWVIGDTVRDIQCARSIDAKVLAVQTGGDSMPDLLAAEPDVATSDLSDFEQAIKTLVG